MSVTTRKSLDELVTEIGKKRYLVSFNDSQDARLALNLVIHDLCAASRKDQICVLIIEDNDEAAEKLRAEAEEIIKAQHNHVSE